MGKYGVYFLIFSLLFIQFSMAKTDANHVESEFLPFIYSSMSEAFHLTSFQLLKESKTRSSKSYLENSDKLKYPEIPYTKITITDFNVNEHTITLLLESEASENYATFTIQDLVWIDTENEDSKRLRLRLWLDDIHSHSADINHEINVHEAEVIDLVFNTVKSQGYVHIKKIRIVNHKKSPNLRYTTEIDQDYYSDLKNLSQFQEHKRKVELTKPFKSECGRVLVFKKNNYRYQSN
ncbi:MAG: hypothetical protein KDD58_06880 [Bdellovibrionales bacterium]|nr:hypothetical protein [Bdellovibrionales bacterium]